MSEILERETRVLLREAAERLFEKHCNPETMRRADGGEFPQALWRALTEAGYTAALVPEAAGGAGLDMSDALSLLVSAGRHAVPAPLAEREPPEGRLEVDVAGLGRDHRLEAGDRLVVTPELVQLATLADEGEHHAAVARPVSLAGPPAAVGFLIAVHPLPCVKFFPDPPPRSTAEAEQDLHA